KYDVIYDIKSALTCGLKRTLDDLRGKTVDLKIHLYGSDTVFGARDLKVHVAEEVLESLDVYHRHPAVTLCYKSAGDAGNRSFYRHTRIHQCKGAAAYGAL